MERVTRAICSGLTAFLFWAAIPTIAISQDKRPISNPGGLRERDLQSMMVELRNSVGERQGYGLILGVLGEVSYALTAGHVVTSIGDGGQVVVPDTRNPIGFLVAGGPTGQGGSNSDLALISFPKPPGQRTYGFCLAPPESPRANMDVWFYGQERAASNIGAYKGIYGGPVRVATNFLDVVPRDSGGVVYGRGGVLGVLLQRERNENRSAGWRIFFTDIHAAIDFAQTAVPGIPRPSLCQPMPDFRLDTAVCEDGRSAECWISAAFDANLAHPESEIRPKLARALGKFGTRGDLERLIEDAGGVNERAHLWVEAADTADIRDRALDYAFAAREELEAAPADEVSVELMARIVGVLGRHGDLAESRATIERTLTAIENFSPAQRARALLQLAVHSVDTGDEAIWRPLSEGAVSASLVLDSTEFHEFSSWRINWLSHSSYDAAMYLPPEFVFARLRASEGQREQVDTPINRAEAADDDVNWAMRTSIKAYAARDQGVRAAEFMREEYMWWRDDDSEYEAVFSHDRAAYALFEAGAYMSAREFILSGIVPPSSDQPIQPNLRYKHDAAQSLLDLAQHVRTDRDPPRRDAVREHYDFAVDYASESDFDYDIVGFAIDLCESGYPYPALNFYQSLLEEQLVELMTIGALHPDTPRPSPFLIRLDEMPVNPDIVMTSGYSNLLAAELPLCIAMGLFDLGEAEAAQELVELSRMHYTSSSTTFDVEKDASLRARFEEQDPAVRAQLLLRTLITYAPNVFDDINNDEARETYGKYLLNTGQPDEARKFLESKVWDYMLDSEPERFFISYLLANRLEEARKIFEDRELKQRYTSYPGESEELFAFAAASEYLAHGQVNEAVLQTARMRSSGLIDQLGWVAYKNAEKFSSSAEEFERRVSPFIEIMLEDHIDFLRAIAGQYADFDDWRRASELNRRAYESDPNGKDSFALDANLRKVVRARIRNDAYSGLSEDIKRVRDASVMAGLFLDAAGIN